MNLRERKVLRDYLISEKGYPPYVAKLKSWQQYCFEKTHIDDILQLYTDWYSLDILEETDIETLEKTMCKGFCKNMLSYPVIIGSFFATILTGNPLFMQFGPVAAHLNWRGEVEWIYSDERIKELKRGHGSVPED